MITDKRLTGRTLKTWSNLLRSNFQAAIISLSFLACKSREVIFRSPFLTIFLWISAMVLGLRYQRVA